MLVWRPRRRKLLLRAELAEAMHAHERVCAPNEAAGLVAMVGKEVVAFYPVTNSDRSPVSYSIDGADILRCADLAESAAARLGGVVHSHPASNPEPSEVDIRQAASTDWIYLITSQGELGAFTLKAGRATRLRVVLT